MGNTATRNTTASERLKDCRAMFEPLFLDIVRNGEKQGWKAAEIAFALAEAADDLIMKLAKQRASKL